MPKIQNNGTPMDLLPSQATDIAGIHRQSFESDFMAQRVADKNDTDMVLIDKISIVLEVIECDSVDEIERGIAQNKLGELIGRL